MFQLPKGYAECWHSEKPKLNRNAAILHSLRRVLERVPKKLNPTQMGLLAAKREFEAMADRFSLGECFECGCCSYVFPRISPGATISYRQVLS